MARQVGVIRFSGKIGNMVGYERGGEGYTRASSEPYELSEESKKSASEFGRGSSASALVRQAFSTLLFPSFRKDPQNRLAERFRQVIRSGPSKDKGRRKVTDGNLGLLTGFEFNHYAASAKLIGFQPKVEFADQFIEVVIPGFSWQKNVHAPGRAQAMALGASCGFFDFESNRYQATQAAELMVEHGQSFNGASLKIPVPEAKEQVILVMMNISFLAKMGERFLRIDRRDAQAGVLLSSLHIRNGQVVVFEAEAVVPEKLEHAVVPVVDWQMK
jgi:hypothetical protein